MTNDQSMEWPSPRLAPGEFAERLLRYLRARSGLGAAARVTPQTATLSIDLGRGGFDLLARLIPAGEASTQPGSELRVELEIESDQARAAMPRLAAQREAIEREIGSPLTWQDEAVVHSRPLNEQEDRDGERQYAWLVDQLEAFHRAFAPRVRALSHPAARPGK